MTSSAVRRQGMRTRGDDMERMKQEKRQISRTEKECKELYRNAFLAHIVFVGFLYYFQVESLAIFFGFTALVYLFGMILIPKSKDLRPWIFYFALEFIGTAFLGNLLAGQGYGFVFYGMMVIPIFVYFIYNDKSGMDIFPYAVGLTIVDSGLAIVSYLIQTEENRIEGASRQVMELVCIVNAIVCIISLIYYSYVFISEMDAKTTSLRYKNDELDYRINYDSLTKVYSREYFFQKVQERILSNPEVEYYMICTDIKDFKLINDLYGHEIADNLLIKEAEQLRAYFQKNGVYGRIGGDKFALCIPKETMWEADFFRLTDSLKGMFRKSSYQLQIYAGVYEMQDIKESISVACDKANIAIASIKGDYQKKVAFYNQNFISNEIKRKQVLSEFDMALRKNQFCIFLQPQTRKDGTAHGAEALVRWFHPTRGLLMPGEFIEYLEQAGVIYKLDMYVWEQAAYRLSEWKKIGREDLHISVNISAKDFYYIDIYATVKALVEKYDINPANLRLELTETALATNFFDVLEVVAKLQESGFIIEIDDFGSGYSSFNMLKDFKADVLKIDREFLNETSNQTRSRTILEGIIKLSMKMKMDVISEGVETREQVDMLTDMGCGMFQGYYFSKPISIEEFEQKYMA